MEVSFVAFWCLVVGFPFNPLNRYIYIYIYIPVYLTHYMYIYIYNIIFPGSLSKGSNPKDTSGGPGRLRACGSHEGHGRQARSVGLLGFRAIRGHYMSLFGG